MSAATKLRDQADRDRIEHELDQTLFVEAGAGTGKTRQLVERIVNLIAQGRAPAARIAAITFTEKAAAELRDRILERLETESDEANSEERRQRCRDALDQLDGAAIETIHAFAARILSLYPLEARLPPGFEIIDETESGVEFAERWRDQLDELLEAPELATPLRDALDAGVTLGHLGKIARKLHEDWDRAESDASLMAGANVNPTPFVTELRSITQQREACIDPADKLHQRLIALSAFADQLEEASSNAGMLVKLLEHSTATSFRVGNVGARRNWPGDAHLPIREALAVLESDRAELRQQVLRSFLAPVYNAIRQFVLGYADERRRRGRLGFQDLLVRCRDLLQNNADVAAEAHRRYRNLLIDEFQDTDPLQTEIVNAIAQGEAGRLFFVGDPKQSIYRFRRADIEQYNHVREGYTGSRVHLTQNFRSQPGITEFVNAVFGPLMTADHSGGQAAWEDLDAAREPPADAAAPATTIIGDELEASAPQARRAEAGHLVNVIAEVRDAAWQMLDPETKTWRSARYADIAVLVPTRTGLSRLLPELDERGIPYRLESRSLVYDSEEVRGLLGILRAIADPTDQIALLGALRAPAFACSDADLFAWKEAGGQWDYRAPIPLEIKPDHPVAEAARWLCNASAAQWRMPVSALVEYVIRERRLMELAVVDRRPRDRWQRLRFLLDQARDFCDRGGRTLNEFLEWAQRQADEDTRVIESVVPESDHDAVRILTIHAAKGLEFPVVILTGLNVEPRAERPVLLWTAGGAPELYFRSGLQTPGYGALYKRESDLEAAERVRRNYVATTRARDHLIVSLYRKPDKNKKSDAHIIADRVEQLSIDPDAPRFRRFGQEPQALPPHSAGGDAEALLPLSPRSRGSLPQRRQGMSRSDRGGSPTDTAADRAQWLAKRQTAIEANANFAVQSATSIAKHTPAADPNLEKDEPPDDLPPWRRGRAGTSIGRAVHSALQTINLEAQNEAEIRTVARAQSAAEGLGLRETTEVARLIRVALNTATVREAVAANRYWRELYVAAPIPDGNGGQTLVEGFIDLLYETAGGELVVVDYKTDALQAGEPVNAALERYQLQGATYALALEQSLGRPVATCRFLFLHANQERDIEDLTEAVSQARQLITQT